MKNFRILPLYLMLTICSLFTFTEAYGQNQLLRTLIKEDQDYRTGKKIARTDQERQKLVLEQIALGAVQTAEDKFNAGIILQHTGLTFCDKRMVSFSPDNYLLAHYLLKTAFESGYEKARYYVAAAMDRYLSFTEGYQKYGTNFLTNQETGKDELVPIDRNTPDSERAKYGVPPLAELLKRYPEQSPGKKP